MKNKARCERCGEKKTAKVRRSGRVLCKTCYTLSGEATQDFKEGHTK